MDCVKLLIQTKYNKICACKTIGNVKADQTVADFKELLFIFRCEHGLAVMLFKRDGWALAGPCLAWLGGLSASLQTKRLPVRFLARAHAWVAGRGPGWGSARSTRSMFFLYIDVSLPLFLPPFSL